MSIPPPLPHGSPRTRAIPQILVLEEKRWWTAELRRLIHQHEFRFEERNTLAAITPQDQTTSEFFIWMLPAAETTASEILQFVAVNEFWGRSLFILSPTQKTLEFRLRELGAWCVLIDPLDGTELISNVRRYQQHKTSPQSL
jgi:hypothetical protein